MYKKLFFNSKFIDNMTKSYLISFKSNGFKAYY